MRLPIAFDIFEDVPLGHRYALVVNDAEAEVGHIFDHQLVVVLYSTLDRTLSSKCDDKVAYGCVLIRCQCSASKVVGSNRTGN
jgi:hypothetical protein